MQSAAAAGWSLRAHARSGPTDGAEVAAAKLQDHARRRAHGAASTSAPASPLAPRSPLAPGAGARLGGGGSAGSTRLRDAIVWGYMMQRHGARSMVGFLPAG